MAIPESQFRFITNGLYTFYEDQSLNTPTSWLWDFGDGNTSADENPNHEFAAAGTYTVGLIATNNDGSSIILELTIVVNVANTISLANMIAFELPALIPTDANMENYFLAKWRRYLQTAFEIEDANLTDATQYTELQNVLLAKLVVFDYFQKLADEYMAASLGAGVGSIAGQISAGGNTKKIETGPTSGEWYSGSKSLQEIFRPNSQGTSTFDKLQQDICGIANHPTIRVKLPMCSLLGIDPMVPIKAFLPVYLSTEDYITKQ